MKIEFFSTYFEKKKTSNIKRHANQPRGSWVVPCGRADRQKGGEKGMKKLIVALRNFAKAPKNTTENYKRLGRW